MTPTRAKQAAADLYAIKDFMPTAECAVIAQNLQGEEGGFFADLVERWRVVIEAMPLTGQTDGQGKDAVVHLHYFLGSADWWITEKDIGSLNDERPGMQLQAFGMADLFGDGSCRELGYISIEEVVEAGGELDLYWTPKTLKEVEEKLG